MPNVEPHPSRDPELWESYHKLLRQLRNHAVWQHEQDGTSRASGRPHPPRFVAVVSNPERLFHYQAWAESLSGLSMRWPVQIYAETWGWARLLINDAPSSRRLPAGKPYVLELGKKRVTDPEVQTLIRQLKGAGHRIEMTSKDLRLIGVALELEQNFPLSQGSSSY